MGPEVGPAFQRRSRDTPSSNIGVRLTGTVSRHVGSKEMRAFWHFGREITYKVQRPVGRNEVLLQTSGKFRDREQVGHIR
eukprot:gene20291-biopygen10101